MPKKLKTKGKKTPTKKAPEGDQGSPAFERVTQVFIENWRMFTVGVVLLGLLIVAVLLWTRSREQRELHASFLLSQGITKVKEGDGLSGEEATAIYEEALRLLSDLVEDYSPTESGRLGIFYVGKCLSRLKRYGEAVREYEKFLSISESSGLYHFLALRSLGFAYQNEKNYQKALATFKLLAETEGSFLKGESTLALAQLYEEMGERQKALEAYKEFLAEYPASVESNRIQKRVAFLETQLP